MKAYLTPAEAKERRLERTRQWRRVNKRRVRIATQAWFKAYPERAKAFNRNNMFKIRYGVSARVVDAMKAKQGHRCKLCRRKTKLDLDHCHKTGRIRGMLCRRCNNWLARLNDDAGWLRRAAAYLEG